MIISHPQVHQIKMAKTMVIQSASHFLLVKKKKAHFDSRKTNLILKLPEQNPEEKKSTYCNFCTPCDGTDMALVYIHQYLMKTSNKSLQHNSPPGANTVASPSKRLSYSCITPGQQAELCKLITQNNTKKAKPIFKIINKKGIGSNHRDTRVV
jgi:hypothetical protein